MSRSSKAASITTSDLESSWSASTTDNRPTAALACASLIVPFSAARKSIFSANARPPSAAPFFESNIKTFIQPAAII